MRSTRRILPVALALLLAASAFAAQGSVPAGYQTQSSTRLANGVDHEALTLADPAQSVHVARVAPGAGRFVAVSSNDPGTEVPSAMCRRVGCYGGINADFSYPFSRQPLGGVVSDGRLLRSPIPGRSQLNVTRDGRLSASPLDWSGSVSGNGRTVPLRGVNVAPRPGDVGLFTPAWAGDTPDGADIYLVVRSSGTIGAIGATTAVDIVDVRGEPVSIPSDGAVLTASGSASAALHEFADRWAAGDKRPLELRISTALDVVESVGGSPVLLRDGQPVFPDADDSFTRGRHPRSLVGWNPSGEVVLVAVDAGHQGASGMTLAEAAEFLRGLGATEGFGFDPANVTFVAAGEVQNQPVGGAERPVPNAFMVVPKPADPPPAPPASNPGTGAKPGSGGTTATTAPAKVTTAGGGTAPAAGGTAAPAAPGATAGKSVLPGNVSNILKSPATKRPRRHTDKRGKDKKTNDGEEAEEAVGDPSIPDWNDITAALTPEAVAAAEESRELSLGLEGVGREESGTNAGVVLIQLLAFGMIGTVLWGLRRAYDDSRPHPTLWL